MQGNLFIYYFNRPHLEVKTGRKTDGARDITNGTTTLCLTGPKQAQQYRNKNVNLITHTTGQTAVANSSCQPRSESTSNEERETRRGMNFETEQRKRLPT